MATNENENTWGDNTNINWNLMEQAAHGWAHVSLTNTGETHVTAVSWATDKARRKMLTFTASLSVTTSVIFPDASHVWFIWDNTDNDDNIDLVKVKTSSATGELLTKGKWNAVFNTFGAVHVVPFNEVSAGVIEASVSAAFANTFANGVFRQTSNYTVATADRGKVILVSNERTVSLLPAGSVEEGFTVIIKRTGPEDVVIDGNDAETIDGAQTLTLTNQNDTEALISNGARWFSIANKQAEVDAQAFAPRQYLSGFEMSPEEADPEHEILFQHGQCLAQLDLFNIAETPPEIRLDVTFRKKLDSSFIAGFGEGGLASSLTLTASTWYHAHALLLDDGSHDFGFDTSPVAENLLADHNVTHFRRIGSIRTDNNSNIIPFLQDGDHFRYVSTRQDLEFTGGVSGVNDGRTLTFPALPPDISTLANINYTLIGFDGTSYSTFFSPGQDTSGVIGLTGPIIPQSRADFAANSNYFDASSAWVRTGTAQDVIFKASGNVRSLYFGVHGWIDSRGKQ